MGKSPKHPNSKPSSFSLSPRYGEVCPSMVERGDWARGDDRRLLKALWRSVWEEEWEVPWGSLVKDRKEKTVRR